MPCSPQSIAGVPFALVEESQKLDIGEFEVVLKQVALPMGLVVDAITLTGSQIHLENHPFRIGAPEPGKITILIWQDNLAQFLTTKAPGGLRDFSVELKDGKIHVQASMKMIVEVRASAICNLRIHENRQLFVDLETVDLMGVGAKNLVQSQLDKINPVLDTKDLPIQSSLTGYEIADGKLTLFGDLFPALRSE